MSVLPLLSEARLAAPLVVGEKVVLTSEFVAQAEALANRLPDRRCLINLPESRHHFLLGWVAACLRGQVILLPPNQTAATLEELRREYPDHHVFDDDAAHALVDEKIAPTATLPDWTMPVDRVAAIVFTSGSTGRPQAHHKTWGGLFHNSRLAARELLGGLACNIAATVPAQHMYGLEASVLCALTAGCRLHDRKPFFPADVRAALAAMPEPRTLVTTPAHLRILAASELEMPSLSRVVSATAPLATDLASAVEKRWNTEVYEIYGCTEAGVMAHRRTVRSPRWRAFAGGHIVSTEGGAAEYRAPQLPAPVPLPDVIEIQGEEFRLLGRAGDMIKVAGKRATLQELTRQVLSVAGVNDAVVFLPDEAERPAALVVAPGMTHAFLLGALREAMDPAFVPRPLRVVEELPRNELGKLPREKLLRALRPEDHTVEIRIPASHPALAGHFPGNPLVPGVVLLEAALARARELRPGTVRSVTTVKFLSPVRPEESVQLNVEFSGDSGRFTGSRNGVVVFDGDLSMQPTP